MIPKPAKQLTPCFILLCLVLLPLQSMASIDSDGDGFTDDEEAFIGTDPNDSDTDDDAIMDSVEAIVGTDPTLFDTITDDDYSSDYTLDSDADGLSNGYELTDGVLGDEQVGNFTGEGGNPTNADTDEDGLGDWFEATYAGTCVDITIDNSDHDDVLDPDDDCDGDTLTNSQEEVAGTSPLAVDTDNDGYTDLAEVTAGSDPTDAVETPDSILEDSVTPNDHGMITEVKGKRNGVVRIAYADATQLNIDAFGGAAKPKVKLATNGERLVTVKGNGRTVKVYDEDGSLLAKKSLGEQPQSKVKLKIWNFYNDAKDEVIIISKRRRFLRTTVVQLNSAGQLKHKNVQRYSPLQGSTFQVKKQRHRLHIMQDGNTIIRYKIQSNGLIKVIG